MLKLFLLALLLAQCIADYSNSGTCYRTISGNGSRFQLQNRGLGTFSDYLSSSGASDILESSVDVLQFIGQAPTLTDSWHCCVYSCCCGGCGGCCTFSCCCDESGTVDNSFYNNALNTGSPANPNSFTLTTIANYGSFCTLTVVWAPYQASTFDCSGAAGSSTYTVPTTGNGYSVVVTYSHWARPTALANGYNTRASFRNNNDACSIFDNINSFGGRPGDTISCVDVDLNLPPIVFFAREPILTTTLQTVYTGSIATNIFNANGVGTTFVLPFTLNGIFLSTMTATVDLSTTGSGLPVANQPVVSAFGGTGYTGGNANKSGQRTFSITFKAAGTYIVTLTLTNGSAANSNFKSYYSFNVEITQTTGSDQSRTGYNGGVVNPVHQ